MSEGTSTRRDQVVQAAIGVFLRYGYARTTMADIAQAAGLSRPTLYLEFPDKDAIFHAVVDAMVANKLTEIRQGLPRYRGFKAKLRFACEAWGLRDSNWSRHIRMQKICLISVSRPSVMDCPRSETC